MTPQYDPVARIRAINRKANTMYALIALVALSLIAGFAWAGR